MKPIIPTELLNIRIRKLVAAISRPRSCWKALAAGVAPAVEHLSILRRLGIDGIIDVGANRGQFTLACRLSKPGVPVVAFEPIPHEATIFRRIHRRYPNVTLEETALGEIEGEATLHLSKNADSSSLLPIGKNQTCMFAGTEEVGTIKVPVKRLDDFSAYWDGRSRQLLKLDVQGFELNVLRGATETLRSCAYVYAECSEISLYDGQALRPEVSALLRLRGFAEQGCFNACYYDGKLIQADYLFARAPRF